MASKPFRQMYEEKYMRFPQGACKAVTLSYDDGVQADKKLIAILNKYGFRGTFNLNSVLFDCPDWHNRMNEEETYNTFSEGAHEVALHGARHIFLNKVPLPEAMREVVLNREYLEKKFARIVNGMAYAYNGFNEEIKKGLAMLGVKYARTTANTHSFALPEDFLEWNPTCHHREECFGELTEKFLNSNPLSEFKHRESLLFFLWGHAYEFDDDNNWEIIENFAQKIASAKDIWLATCGEVCDYVNAYKSLVFSLNGEMVYNPSAIPVWLELRGKIYKIEPAQTVLFDED